MAHPMSVDRLDLGDHVCWTFDDDGERLDGMARFVAAALGSGHLVLYATAAVGPDALLAGLRERGVEVDGPLGTGQLRVRPASETHLVGATGDPERAIDGLAREVEEALSEGYRGVRIVADVAWARTGDVEWLVRYEELVNTLFAGGAALGLCQYDRRLFGPADLHRLGTAHPGTTWVEEDSAWVPLLRMHHSADRHRLELVGEVDMSNGRAVAPVLGAMRGGRSSGERSPLVVDASGLTFADASAAGLLVMAARSAPAGLQVRDCTPAVARTLEIIGAREVPGMAVTVAV